MENNKESKVLIVMGMAIKFIGTLNENQLEDLINKKSKFDIKIKKKNNANIKIKKENEDNKLISVISKINRFTDREETKKYIEDLKFTNERLIILGKRLGIKIPKNTRKCDIISIIVEDTVGNRLKVEGLRKGIIGGNY